MTTRSKPIAILTALAFVLSGIAAAAPASAAPPADLPVITAPADGAVLAGDVPVVVQSSAPRVAVLLDGVELQRGWTTAGEFSFTWSTWGLANGARQITAVACDDMDVCAASGDVAAVTLANAAPVITSPASGTVVQSGTTLALAFTAGGTVGVRVDGVILMFASSSPAMLDLTAVTEGSHDLTLVACTADQYCDGPVSDPVTIVVDALQPQITSVLPNPFSPNGDGAKDATTVTYTLDQPQDVVVTVLAATDDVVLGPIPLGTLTAGTHTWVWDGTTTAGTRASDGTYAVQLATSTADLTATVEAAVVLDAVAPTIKPSTVSGATFYPYPDGYRDTFKPVFGLNEPAALKLIIRNSSGTIVRTLTGNAQPGTVGLTWNGRTASGSLVAAGTYTWQYTATDPVGNRRIGSRYTVTVSLKKLVSKTLTVQVSAASFYASARSSTCAYRKGSNYGSSGAWLYNGCDSRKVGPTFIEVGYRVTLPKAVSYGTLSLSVYGHTHPYGGYEPLSAVYGWIDRADDPDAFVSGGVGARSTGGAWYKLASTSAKGFVNSSRQVYCGWGVENYFIPPPNDFDAKYVKVTVTAKVLV